jgi:cytidine deaminase
LKEQVMATPHLPSQWQTLQTHARQVRQHAWAPYSRFSVGAALLTTIGEIITGCNVENASYGLTICAERAAVCRAIAMGLRDFSAICITLPGIPVPCGSCRQFLTEFNPEMLVLLDSLDQPAGTPPECVLLSELLPRAFSLNHNDARPPADPAREQAHD